MPFVQKGRYNFSAFLTLCQLKSEKLANNDCPVFKIRSAQTVFLSSRNSQIDRISAKPYDSKVESSILIVDDIPTNRKLLRVMLKNEVGIIKECSNGTEALELLRNNPPFGLILMDMNMPVMGGHELLGLLRQRKLETPVLACSAARDLEIAVKAMKLGARDFIEFPVHKEVLLNRVRTLLKESILLKENRNLRSFLESRFVDYFTGTLLPVR